LIIYNFFPFDAIVAVRLVYGRWTWRHGIHGAAAEGHDSQSRAFHLEFFLIPLKTPHLGGDKINSIQTRDGVRSSSLNPGWLLTPFQG